MNDSYGYNLRTEERYKVLNVEIERSLYERFELYRTMFAFDFYQIDAEQDNGNDHAFLSETGLEERITRQCRNNETPQFSLAETLLFSKIKEIQKIVKIQKGSVNEYADQLPEFLENNDLLVKDINEYSACSYNYFFIQALLSHLKEMLIISYERDGRNCVVEDQLEYIAQTSIALAENYSDFSVSYKDIELTKDRQYDRLEKLTDEANDFIYSLGELSNLTSKSGYIEALLTKLKIKYLNLDAAEERFDSLFEYLGYLSYVGNDHFLYEMAIDELQSNIVRELSDLTLPDIVFLLEDDIHSFVDDSDLEFQGWSHLKKCVFSSEEFDRLVDGIKSDFLNIVPEYFPE